MFALHIAAVRLMEPFKPPSHNENERRKGGNKDKEENNRTTARHGQRWRESEDAGRGRSSCLYKKVQACGGQRVRDVTAVFVQHVHSAVLAGRLACV